MSLPATLSQDIANGNLRKCIPEEVYQQTLAQTFEQLDQKLGDAHVAFDPEKHLKYYLQDPLDQHKFHSTRRITMEELGLSNKMQVSPIGVSDPFPLFTDEAVDLMKRECLRKERFLEHARVSYNSTSGLDCVMRGYATEKGQVLTPFIYEAWKHPKTMELVSMMAGVDLEVVMDYEIAHVNIGVTDPHTASMQRTEHQREERERLFRGESSGEDIPAIVGWHNDSFPFVCVLMLSDTSEMIGGETYLRMGDQKIARVSAPQKGSAAVLQGRYIKHLAPKPLGATERITMVTSYRAKSRSVHDGSVINTSKPEINFGSRYNEFYRQWVLSRMDYAKAKAEDLRDKVLAEDAFDKPAAIDMLKQIEEYIRTTYQEMELLAEEVDRIKRAG